MRIIFAGTPEIAAISLKALIQAKMNIIAVYTQPDRPQGRGQKLTASPTKYLALENNIPVESPASLRNNAEVINTLKNYQPDLIIVCAYGLILPKEFLNIPPYGCWNIHVSLLPRWRGAAPIQRAIEAGDQETGICIMQMDEGLDTGDILLMHKTPIFPTENSAELHDRLADLGSKSILEALDLLAKNKLQPIPQSNFNNSNITYAKKLEKSEGLLNFSQQAEIILNKIRAFNPFPMASFKLPQKNSAQEWVIKIHAAELVKTPIQNFSNKPGQILESSPERLIISCGPEGQEAISIIKLQIPGGKAMAWKELYKGHVDLFNY